MALKFYAGQTDYIPQLNAMDASFAAVTNVVSKTSSTGSSVTPTGTTAQRDAAPLAGYMRYNTTTTAFEGYSGTVWATIGAGGAVGSGTDKVFYENDQTVTASYTITTGKNAMSAGPITVSGGAVVTVPTGSVWHVL